MVDKKLLDRITDEVAKQCASYGIAEALRAEQVYENECVVKVDEMVSRQYDEQLGKIADSLASIPGVANVYDAGRGMYRSDGYRAFEIQVRDGYWTHTETDEKLLNEDMEQYFNEEVAAKKEKERHEKRLRRWKENLLPMPEADVNAPDEVYLVLAYEPYDWIKNGEKETEFRSYTSRYMKRLVANKPKRVRFQRGYGGPGRPKPEQMVFEVKRVKLYDIMTRTIADPYKPEKPIVPTHIAVYLGKRIS